MNTLEDGDAVRVCKDCCFFEKIDKEYGKCNLAPKVRLVENGHLYTLCIYNLTPACERFKNNEKS